MKKNKSPRILLWDIETSPIEALVWGLRDQNIALNQVQKESTIISWSAKWLGEDEIFQMDTGGQRDIRNDKKILKKLWRLLDESDIQITQNGIAFDLKIANGRFLIHKMGPPSVSRQQDTLRISKKHFKLLSHKLEYMTGRLLPGNKKDDHSEFPGFSLWTECLNNNPKAWNVMRKYNKKDVTVLEDLFKVLAPWGTGLDLSVYNPTEVPTCNCGNTNLQRRGYNWTNNGQFQRYQCIGIKGCGSWMTDKKNLLSKEKRASLVKK